jgi:hypothetical protein
MWMPLTPTIEINGVRIGSDKLSHFVSSGWRYHTAYREALRSGKSAGDAERAAIRRGLLEERLILGKAVSGILSIADMEANLQGMLFYLDLCLAIRPGERQGCGRSAIDRPGNVIRLGRVPPNLDLSHRWGRSNRPAVVLRRLRRPRTQATWDRYREHARLPPAVRN